jgi:Tfp pilus assembly protein PilF
MYSSRLDDKGNESRTNGPHCSPRQRRTIGHPSIAALTDRELSTAVVRPLEHRNLRWQRKLRQTERNKLHELPQITGAVAQQILRGHSFCQRRRNALLAITERLYGTLRWIEQGSLPWLLLGLLICTPIVRAQIAGFDNQAGEIFGTVFVEGGNRPIDGVIVNIRSLTEGPFVSVLTDWSGRFQVRGLNSGAYEIVVEEAGYEPIRETLQLLRGPSPPLELYLKAGNSAPAQRTDYAVSVRELRIPVKARNAFEKGLERLAKNDAHGSRAQFLRATVTFPDYYEAYYHMGVADLRLGREEEAAQAFQKAIDLSGGRYAWAQFALGLLLCRRGEYAEADTIIREGLGVDGRSATGHLFLSVALFRLNRLEEAEKSAREALLRKPGFAWAYLVLADVHGRRGEYGMQLHDLNAYLKLEPDGPASKVVREVREVVRRIVFKTEEEE